MASQIDPTKPADGVPAVKSDLRTNLARAKSEIEALQTQFAAFPQSGFTGRRNRLLNGNMYTNARGVANANIPLTGAGSFLVDRWFGQVIAGGATMKQTRLLGSEAMPGVPHNSFVRLQTVTAKSPGAADYHVFGQCVEAINIQDLKWGTNAARPVTLSFWARASIAGNYAVRVGNATDASYVAQYTIIQTNTWEYKSVTIPGYTGGTFDPAATTGYLKVHFDLGCGANKRGLQNNWLTDTNILSYVGAVVMCATTNAFLDITGVQLEQDTVASPFEMPQPILEAQACARYYQIGQWSMGGYIAAGGSAQLLLPWPYAMRATPTLSQTGTNLINLNTPTYTANYLAFTVAALGVVTGSYGFSGTMTGDAEIW